LDDLRPGQIVAFSPDGRSLASAYSLGKPGTVTLWDARTGARQRSIPVEQGSVKDLTFSPDARHMAGIIDTRDFQVEAGGKRRFAVDPELLCVWDTATSQQVYSRSRRQRDEWLAFCPDGNRLVTLGGDGALLVRDAEPADEIVHLAGLRFGKAGPAVSPDGRILAKRDSTGHAMGIWDTATGREIARLPMRGVLVSSLAISPDNKRLVTGEPDGVVRLWDIESGHAVLVLKGHTQEVSQVVFSPDGQRLASGSWDGSVRVWDARPLTEEVRNEQEAVGLLQFLFDKPLLKTEVGESLRTDKTISDEVRRNALALLERFRDEPERFDRVAWAVVRQAGASVEAYDQALHRAETACRLAPGHQAYQDTLAFAQYRLGQHPAALKTLTRRRVELTPKYLACLAMAHQRLGHAAAARDALNRLRTEMKMPQFAADEHAKALVREAEALCGGEPLQPPPGAARQ
jgi:hypothetical protein